MPAGDALVAVPRIDPGHGPDRPPLEGDVPSPQEAPRGRPFATRWPRVLGPVCHDEPPPVHELAGEHRILCPAFRPASSWGARPVPPRWRSCGPSWASTGLVLIQLFSFELGWLPANASVRPGTGFLEALPQLILPAATATLVMLAYVARLTRASVLDELPRPCVRPARLKGIPARTVLRNHVLPNALLPTITVVAISFGWLVSGLIVVENVFNYPGLGRLLTFAIDRRDLPLMQAITSVAVAAFAVANLIADLLDAWLDPRIRRA